MALTFEGEINLILNDFGNTFKKAAEFYAAKYVNTKNGKDTLSNSDLLKSLKIEVKDERLIISVYNYYKWVASGRKKGEKGVPISVLLDWIKKNKIKGRNKTTGRFISNNSLAFAIQISIKKKGISKRPFLEDAYNETIKIFDNKLNDLIDDLLKDILIRFIKTK